MRGRKPKPTQLKDLHGSQEPRNPNEPIPETVIEIVPPPEHFDEDMRQIWRFALEHAPPGMLKAIDAAVLEVWCVAHALHRKAVRAQQRYALVIPAPVTKYPIQAPYLAIINRQALVMMRAAAELGFSPTARPRVGNTVSGGDELNTGRRPNATGESLDGFLARAPSIH